MARDLGLTEDRSVELAGMATEDLAALATDSHGHEYRAACQVLDERDAANKSFVAAVRALKQAAMACDMAGCTAPDGYDYSDVSDICENLRRAEA